MTVQKRYPNFENSKEKLNRTSYNCTDLLTQRAMDSTQNFLMSFVVHLCISSNVELTTRHLVLSTDITWLLSSWRLVAQMSQVFSIFNSNAFKESYLPPPIKNGFFDVSTYFQALLNGAWTWGCQTLQETPHLHILVESWANYWSFWCLLWAPDLLIHPLICTSPHNCPRLCKP